MAPIQRILFPIDFSRNCDVAAGHVAGLARANDAELTLFYSVEPLPPAFAEVDPSALTSSFDPLAAQTEFLRELESYLPEAFAGLTVRRLVRNGDPGTRIVETATEIGADLIAIPSHGLNPFRRFLLGSVTAKVLHDARVPVWTSAHREISHHPEFALKEILCAVDLSGRSECVLAYAHRLAAHTGADLHLIHVVPGTDEFLERYFDNEFRVTLVEEATRRLQELQAKVGTSYPVKVVGGELGHAIRELEQTFDADLLVIGRGHVKETVFGRLRTHSYEIIRESPCPVISV
jgi:nucleotide-binding universal stress UspA family protein